jgi:hypothetical protein
MRLRNLEQHNPASALALVGIMRITGARSRWCGPDFYEVEIDRSLSASDLLPAASARLQQLLVWPDDADEEWWLDRARAAEPGEIDTIAMLGSQTRHGKWAHSQWRMIFGQQRWLRMIRTALGEIDAAALDAWLESSHWPRNHYMGMSGVDCGAYCPPAHNWTADTSKLSSGNPVSLWLMWEGMHILPTVPISGYVVASG